MNTRSLRHPFFIRLFHWEYWSFLAVYIWIYPIWVYYCLKARSFFFFAASNPGIEYGGFINESKKDIHTLIPEKYNPETVFFDLPVNPLSINHSLHQHGLDFPLIGKPNKGGRGRGVKILHNESDVIAYAENIVPNTPEFKKIKTKIFFTARDGAIQWTPNDKFESTVETAENNASLL